jgi:adenosine deaminase
MVKSKHLKDQQDIADAFNNYYSTVTSNLNKNNINNMINEYASCTSYLEQYNVNLVPNFVIRLFSTKEIL